MSCVAKGLHLPIPAILAILAILAISPVSPYPVIF
jgi:hypothetical protein